MSLRPTQMLMILGLALLVSASAWAEIQLNSDSRIWKRAKLIAPTQQVWSFQTSYQKTSERFSSLGKLESLGRRYGRAVTWGRLLAAENSASVRAEMQRYMSANGADENDIAATATYELEREDVGLSLDWAYGLTKSWMIGFQVPFVMRTMNVQSRVELTPTLASGVRGSATLRGAGMDSKVRQLAEQELENSGYDRIPDQQREWSWGDVSLLSQFYLHNGSNVTWSLQQLVRFPSSRNPSVADYFQQTTDDGQLDLGISSLTDYRVKRWTLGMRFGYVAQLPDSAKMNVEDASSGTSDVEYTVDRDLGDWVWGALDADLRVTSRIALNAEYSFLSKGEDKFNGNRLSGDDYAVLSEGTDQELHQTRVGLLYNLGDRTARSGVESKWVTSVGYTYPWMGRNSLDASRASLEIINYF